MDIKLVAIDLDDTLLNSRSKISKTTKSILKKISSKDIIIILATGRMPNRTEPFVDMINIDCPIIVYNGAMLRDRRNKGRKILFHKPLQSAFSDIVINYCQKHNFCLNFYLDDVLYSQKNPAVKRFQHLYSKRTGARYILVDDLRIFLGKKPTKLILITDSVAGEKFRTRDYQFTYFLKAFGDRVRLFRTDPEYLEIQHKNTNKAVALDIYATKYGINKKQIMAFGNGENDIAMLRYAGISIAVNNASEIVKKHADIVAKWTNEEDGVAKILKQYILD
ncbi:MAG TPA: Cof-type HAD-IIB family hydrolase [bacterium]|nr:Cof-type HAD-IIB family hydrolase [bacterium]